MRLRQSAGDLLLPYTPEEAVEPVSHELAHGIACHTVEKRSWLTMVVLMAWGRLFLAGYGVLSATSIVGLLMGLTHKQHEYEADAKSAIISKAEGCSSDSIMTAIQRHHAADCQLHYLEHKDYFDSTQLQETLAALQRLLPSRQHLPEWISNSKQLDDIAQLVQCGVRNAPADIQEQAAVLMAQLQYCLGTQLFQWIDLPRARFSSHPHWLDRIKRVAGVLASLPPVAGSTEQGMACTGKGTASSSLSLSEYQADDIWRHAPEYASGGCIAAWLELRQIRSYSPKDMEIVTSMAELKLYDQAAQDVAWGEAMARNEAVQQLSGHLKDAGWVL